MTKRKAIQESIRHWKRMVAWAKARDPKKAKDAVYNRMVDDLDEWPCSDSCALCQKYFSTKTYCTGCPLYESGNCCNEDDSFFLSAYWSDTWGDFVKAGKKMIKVLKSL